MRASLLSLLLLTATCTSNSPTASQPSPTLRSPSPQTVLTFHPEASATVVAGGCGQTKVYRGGIPASLDEAGDHNNPAGLNYVIANPPIAAGFIFSYPLTSGPQGDKILWVVGARRNGEPLAIDAHPFGADQPIVYFNKDADSSPGEIYPSGLAVPTAGCWILNLRWGRNRAEADLEYG